MPLKAIPLVGGVISICSFVALMVFVVKFLAFGVPFSGFGTIVGISLLMFGFLFSILGIMGQYIGLIYEEVKRRPNYIVRTTVGIDRAQSQGD
jgi:dolichol-phosphate mannosyltransferase